MIPVTLDNVRKIDIIKDRDKEYLNNEINFLRKKSVIISIITKANNIIQTLHNPKSIDYNFFKKLCVDFDLLEEKCKDYVF